MNIWF